MSRDDHELSEHRELFAEVDDILERSWARSSERPPALFLLVQAVLVVVVGGVAAVLLAPSAFVFSAAIVVAAVFVAAQRVRCATEHSGGVTGYLADLWERSSFSRRR